MRKHIHVIATGGTIASKAPTDGATSGYAPSVYGAAELIGYVPGIPEDIHLTAEQLFRKQSLEITDADMVLLTKQIDKMLKKDEIDGVVVLMGTDTLEEVSYFAHLTVRTSKPIVFTGAMRPANAPSADGVLNILTAILVAADDNSRDKGVVIAMNDYIVSARDVFKASTFKTGSFAGGDYGVLGTVKNGDVQYRYQSVMRHTSRSEFDITEIEAIPLVEIVSLHQGCTKRPYCDAVRGGCAGIIFAGFGNAALQKEILEELRVHPTKIPLIRASRVATGGGFGDYGYFDQELSTMPNGDLCASKSRILLCVALCYTQSNEEIRRIFAEY